MPLALTKTPFGRAGHTATRATLAARVDPMRWLVDQTTHLTHGLRPSAKFLGFWLSRALGITEARKFNAAHAAEAMTFVLPGIESASIFTDGICDNLVAGGLRGAVRVFDWGRPFPGGYFANLTHMKRNRRRGVNLAREIMAYQDTYPGRPVHLVAHSGGCGVAIFAVEALADGRSVDSVVLLAGALSPTYDLLCALSRVRHGILNSYSARDWCVLGVGTRLFGTTDRKYGDGCGLTGFTTPENIDESGRQLYLDKLTQICWRQEMVRECGHFGGHFTSVSEEYLKRKIAPWMMRVS